MSNICYCFTISKCSLFVLTPREITEIAMFVKTIILHMQSIFGLFGSQSVILCDAILVSTGKLYLKSFTSGYIYIYILRHSRTSRRLLVMKIDVP